MKKRFVLIIVVLCSVVAILLCACSPSVTYKCRENGNMLTLSGKNVIVVTSDGDSHDGKIKVRKVGPLSYDIVNLNDANFTIVQGDGVVVLKPEFHHDIDRVGITGNYYVE